MSLRIFRVFKCIRVGDKHWLAADMRLPCYTSQWVRVQPHAAAAPTHPFPLGGLGIGGVECSQP